MYALAESIAEKLCEIAIKKENQYESFELVFKNALSDILDAITLTDREKFTISISTSQFPSLSFNCYIRKRREQNGASQQEIDTALSEFLEMDDLLYTIGAHSELDMLLELARQALAFLPIRTKFIKERFLLFVTQLRLIYDNSRLEIEEYLVRCLTHEASAENSRDNAEGNRNLTAALISRRPFATSLPHTIGSSRPLQFESTDPILNETYEGLLDSIRQGFHDQTPETMQRSAKLIVQKLRHHYSVEYFETDRFESKEEQVQLLYELLLGSELTRGIVPSYFLQQAESILNSTVLRNERLFPQEEQMEEVPMAIENLRARLFLEDELVELVTNVKTVVNLLNEYDPQFHPQFPFIFRDYVNLVYEEFRDVADQSDFLYIEKLSNLVDQMSEYEANDEDIDGDIIREIIEDFHYNQGFLTSAYRDSTLLMRLAMRHYTTSFECMKRYFKYWNDKTISLITLESALQNRLTQKNLVLMQQNFTRWYDRYMKTQKLSKQAGIYSSKKLIAKVLKDYWIVKLINHGELESQTRKSILNRCFKKWHAKYVFISENELRLQSIYNRGILSATFQQLKSKTAQIQLNYALAKGICQNLDERTAIIVKRDFLHRWHQALDNQIQHSSPLSEKDFVLSKKLAKLNAVANRHLTSKVFGLWRKRMELQQIYLRSVKNNRQNLKKVLLKEWKTKFELQKRYLSAISEQDYNLKHSAFKFWLAHKAQSEKARQFLRANTLKAHFKAWVLARKKRQASFDRLTKLEYFKNWKLNAVSLEFRMRLKKEHLELSLEAWISKWHQINANKEKAAAALTLNLKSDILKQWISRVQMNEEFALVANLHIARRFYTTWRDRMLIKQEMETQSQNFQKGFALNDRISLKTLLKVWRAKLVARFEDYSNDAIISFDQTVRQRGTLLVFLQYWKARTVDQMLKQEELNMRLQEYNVINPALEHHLKLWKSKLLRNDELEAMSENFNTAVLHKKFLVVWYEKLVLKVNYLDELAEELLNQKSYSTSVEYLRKWNLKYVKTYKRNLQTCEMFQEKWNLAKARCLLQVWRHKAFHEDKTHEEPDAYGDANTSIFYSSLSPLAKKRGSFFEGHSYLHTPIKKQVGAPFTPSSRIRRTSPSRLHDANQRMNSDKIDALINHYKKAHNSKESRTKRQNQTSPLRLQDVRTIRLSPPRRNNNGLDSYGLPSKPPAPQFESILTRESSPRATSSPFEPNNYQRLPSPLPLAEIDPSILSTAKRLRRFRPLVIPNNYDGDEPQPSPVTQLKERLAKASKSASRNESQVISTDA